MRTVCLALIAVVAACGGLASPQARGSSPTPSISPVADSWPSPPPSPGPAPIPFSTPDFTCRLPVFVDIGQGSPGAFIDFPSGTVTPDPAAAKVSSITRPGRELVGDFYVHYYDRAYSRWLPVTRNAVSPDGAYYAYTDRVVADPQNPPTRATIHVVNVKTGVDLAFDDGAWSAPYVVLDYAAEGIYLTTTLVAFGLWLMNPATGAVTQVANPWDVQGSAGNKFFWVGAVNTRDPHALAGPAPDELDRLNLVDGSRVGWFYRPGSATHFVSQDVAGHPVIIVSGRKGQATELLLLLGPGIKRSILTFGDKLPSLASPISDNHGVWFGSPDGIYLYSEANGLHKVSDQPGYPANGCL
jgi:hypothetical protein